MSKPMDSNLIFDKSRSGRRAFAQAPLSSTVSGIPESMLRTDRPRLPEASELQTVRHFTRLSQMNFSIDTQFYPLGSCTMKYNPRACNALALLPEFAGRHPLGPVSHGQGFLSCMFELQEMLKDVTGMKGVSLTPMAGAQGELAGVAMIKAYHEARGDHGRTEIICPDAAHGTNPATATMCGCVVIEVPTGPDGDVDMDALENVLGPKTAGIMLTNPSTLGVFERHIKDIADMVHDMNLHKTFSTPHGGGGPGSGAVGVNNRLLPFMPIPVVGKSEVDGEAFYDWLSEEDVPQSIGRLSGFMGNSGVLLRAYVYMRMLGRDGMERVSEYATLNANYLAVRLRDAGFELAFPTRRASHEFIVTMKREARTYNLTAMDIAKALLDKNYHAPTTYFPLLVPECLLIEPTETESKETLDNFVTAMIEIAMAAKEGTEFKEAPYTMPVRRLDDVKAARQLDLAYRPD